MAYRKTSEEVQLDIAFDKFVGLCRCYLYEKDSVKDVLSYMRESVNAAFAFNTVTEKTLEKLLDATIRLHQGTALSTEILDVLRADILRTFRAIKLRNSPKVILMEMRPECIEMVKYIFGFDIYDKTTGESRFSYVDKKYKYNVLVTDYSISQFVRFTREYSSTEKSKFDKIIFLLDCNEIDTMIRNFPQLLSILNRFRIHERFNQKINKCNLIDGDRLEENILHDQWLFEKICQLEE